jgi:hypothetical protein
MSKRDLAEKLILQRAKKEPIDILDRDFVDDFIEKTGCKFNQMPYGAHKCKYLGQTLSRMHKEGMLDRGIIGLSGMETGFPKWVYVYSKPNNKL